jgi:MFS family permease
VAESFSLSNTQQGALASAFNLGFMSACPLAGVAASFMRPKYVIMCGLVVLAVAMALCGLSSLFSTYWWGYYLLIACRALTGVGESAFSSLAPPMIDDLAPPKYRTVYLSVYYMAIPIGISLGFGGAAVIIRFATWQFSFYLESCIIVAMTLILFLVPARTEIYKEMIANKQPSTNETTGLINDHEQQQQQEAVPNLQIAEKKYSVIGSVIALFTNPAYVFPLIGYTSFVFVNGAFAFWAPVIVRDTQKLSLETANICFAVMMLFDGIFGAAFGGILLDKLGGSVGFRGAARASALCAICMAVSLIVGVSAFMMTNVYAFFALLTVALFFGMSTASPNSSIFLSVCPKQLCNMSVGLQIFVIHLCGDFPSPLVFGGLVDSFGGGAKAMRTSVFLLWSVQGLGIIFYAFGALIARSKANREDFVKNKNHVYATEKSKIMVDTSEEQEPIAGEST